MRPGLWEITSIMDAPPPTPEQMQRIKIMSENIGENILLSTKFEKGKWITKGKQCITQEEVNGQIPLSFDPDDEYEYKNRIKTGNSYKMDFICKGPDGKVDRKGKAVFKFTPEKSTGRIEFTSFASDHAPKATLIEMEGRWLGKNCGTIDPE